MQGFMQKVIQFAVSVGVVALGIGVGSYSYERGAPGWIQNQAQQIASSITSGR